MSLPRDCWVVRVQRERVLPGFVSLTDGNREVARGLIRTFRDSVGRKRRALDERLEAGEPPGTTAATLRFRKGLIFLLERRCRFVVESAVEPATARRRLFGAAGGPVPEPERRAALLGAVAAEFGVSPEALEGGLWADLEPEMVLREFDPPEPDGLLREFNRQLACTLLGTAGEVVLEADPDLVLPRARILGLDVAARGGAVRLARGSARGDERFTEAIARLFEAVAPTHGWSWSAVVRLPGRGFGRRVARRCSLRVDDSLGPLFAETAGPPPEGPGLLSRVSLREDVVPLAPLAVGQGVDVARLREVFRNGAEGYLLAGDCLVKRSFAESLRRRLPRAGLFADLCRRVEEAGVPSAAALLEILGYRVRWSGLDPSKAQAVAQEGD